MSTTINFGGDGCPWCGASRAAFHVCSGFTTNTGAAIPWGTVAPAIPIVMTGGLTPPVPSERERWLARGLEQALSWITLDGHVPQRTLRRSLRRWLLHRLITEEQRSWLASVLHGNYPAERYPDSPGVKP